MRQRHAPVDQPSGLCSLVSALCPLAAVGVGRYTHGEERIAATPRALRDVPLLSPLVRCAAHYSPLSVRAEMGAEVRAEVREKLEQRQTQMRDQEARREQRVESIQQRAESREQRAES
jgi:hypothetical protein